MLLSFFQKRKIRMQTTYDFFYKSNFNFIKQYKLLKEFDLLEKLKEEKDVYNQKKLIINIFFNYKSDLISHKEIDVVFNKVLNQFNKTFELEKELKDYLNISDEIDIKEEKQNLNDNFHVYLFYYSKLSLPIEIKEKLDIKNLKILISIEKKQEASKLLDLFNCIYHSLYPYNTTQKNNVVQNYVLSLQKKMGVIPNSTKILGLDQIFSICKEKKENKKELDKKELDKDFLNYMANLNKELKRTQKKELSDGRR